MNPQRPIPPEHWTYRQQITHLDGARANAPVTIIDVLICSICLLSPMVIWMLT